MRQKSRETPGAIVARLRQARGWTAAALAREAGTQPSTVTRMEAGQRMPGLEVARRIFAALGEEGRRAWATLLDK